MRTLLAAVPIIVLTLVAISCGGGSGDDNKAVTGVQGGVVTSDDGQLTLDIPPGALDGEIEITISAVSMDEVPETLREASGPGPAYLLEPDGLVFNEPVAVTLELNRSELEGVPEDGVVAYVLLTQDADGEVEPLDELLIDATLGEDTIIISGELSHFSYITKSDGALQVDLERVEPRQLVGATFVPIVLFRNISSSTGVGFDIERVFVNHFGVPVVNTVGDFITPGTVTVGGLRARIHVGYVCSGAGAGQYGIDTTWRVTRSTPDSELYESFSVTIRGKVDCVTTLATPTPTYTPQPEFATSTLEPTYTPQPEFPTSAPQPKPTSESAPTSTPVPTIAPEPTNTPVLVDPAAHITTMRLTTSSLEDRSTVFVGLGADASQSMTHYRFTVKITLGGQVGIVDVRNGSDNSVAPEGGSLAVGVTGVTMVFLKDVQPGETVLFETFHQEFADSPLGSETNTLTH